MMKIFYIMVRQKNSTTNIRIWQRMIRVKIRRKYSTMIRSFQKMTTLKHKVKQLSALAD